MPLQPLRLTAIYSTTGLGIKATLLPWPDSHKSRFALKQTFLSPDQAPIGAQGTWSSGHLPFFASKLAMEQLGSEALWMLPTGTGTLEDAATSPRGCASRAFLLQQRKRQPGLGSPEMAYSVHAKVSLSKDPNNHQAARRQKVTVSL